MGTDWCDLPNKELKGGDIVFVYKSEKGGRNNKYLGLIRGVSEFDHGISIVVEFLGGKTEIFSKEDDIEPVSDDEFCDYIIDKFYSPLDDAIFESANDKAEVFLRISEILKQIVR